MVVLKKIKSATLVETITASTLLIIVFVIATMILNNVFFNSIKNDTSEVSNYMEKLTYQYQNNLIDKTDLYKFKNWNITIETNREKQLQWIYFKAVNSQTKRTYSKRILDDKN